MCRKNQRKASSSNPQQTRPDRERRSGLFLWSDSNTASTSGILFFLASNIAAHNNKLKNCIKDLEPVIDMGPDALIMSDPGLIMMVRERFPQVPVHLSVQSNVVNDDLEIGRHIKIAWREQAVMTNMINLSHRRLTSFAFFLGKRFHARQDRVTNMLKRLGYTCRTNDTGRVAATQCQHSATPPAGYRRGCEQVARQPENRGRNNSFMTK